MNNLMVIDRQEAFEGYQLTVIEHGGEEWFTAKDIAKALEYANGRMVHNLYHQYQDEFDGLSTVVESVIGSGKTRKHRVFNLQGCQLIGFFARTPRGKLFRRWASNMLAHGIHKMQDHILKLEESILDRVSWDVVIMEAKIKELTVELAQIQKAKALPAPESQQSRAEVINVANEIASLGHALATMTENSDSVKRLADMVEGRAKKILSTIRA